MDLGKAKLNVGSAYTGNETAAFTDLYRACVVLGAELAVTSGLAELPASVAIARGQAVNIFNGQLRLADASLSRPAIGVCVKAAAVGQKATIILGMGYASGLSGLTINSSVYLGNAGALVFVKPVSGFIQGLGYTLSATELFVHVSAP
jgi:hypothetical protein